MVVWRYVLNESGDLSFPGVYVFVMSEGAKVLSAQYQSARGCISLWVLVDEKEEIKTRRVFFVKGTGVCFEDVNSKNIVYVDTCQVSHGVCVWHVFERLGQGD